MDLLRPNCRILPQKPPWTTEPDRLDPGWAHSLCVPKVQGGLHEPLHYHWCRCCCAVYCGLSRVPLEERVTREICVYATTGDVHEAEGIRPCLQGVTPLWCWEAGRCMTQSCTGGETMSTQAAEQHEQAAEQYGHAARHYEEAAKHQKAGNHESRASCAYRAWAS
jgi:hypothetical protein